MKNIVKNTCLLFALLACSFNLQADPWFTGSLLFDSAETAPPDSGGIAVIFENSNSPTIYDYAGNIVSIPLSMSNSATILFGHGLTSNMDLGLFLYYNENQTQGLSSSGFGDTAVELGYQVLTQDDSNYRPNFRISVTQLFPTGRYSNLNPSLYATDATGIGSYQTAVGLNFDLLTQFKGTSHYLKVSGSVTGTLSATTKIRGLNTYGGDIATIGYINPGNAIALDLAAEYTLTQNWVAVIETFLMAQKASVFTGILGPNPASFDAYITENITRNNPDTSGAERRQARIQAYLSNHIRPTTHNIGNAQNIGSGNMYLLDLAPAIEYNFTENFGVIGGVVFTLEGKNSPYYFNSVLQFVYGW